MWYRFIECIFYFKHGVSMWSESPVWHSSDFLRKRSLSSVFLSESESSNTSNSCLFLKESCSNRSWNITDYRKFKKTYNLQTVLRLRYFIAQLCLTRLLINDSGVRFWRCLSSSFRIQVVIDINTCHLFVLVPVTKKHPVDGKSCSNIPQTYFVW